MKQSHKPQVSEYVSIDEMAKKVLETLAQATPVVGWYANGGTVRGPFCRWFHVTEVAEEYEKNVGSMTDDVLYASTCMNYAPSLAEEVIRLKANSNHTTCNAEVRSVYEENAKLKLALLEAASALDWCTEKFGYVHPGSVGFAQTATDKAAEVLGMTISEIFNYLENQESEDEN